jgi:hypothetical protein
VKCYRFLPSMFVGHKSSAGTATRCGLDGPKPIPEAERSKARVYGFDSASVCCKSFAGVACSNPVGGMDVCVVCCQ